MSTRPDISSLPPAELVALKAAIDARLDEIKQRHMEEGAALGLRYVDGPATPRRKRRNDEQKEAE